MSMPRFVVLVVAKVQPLLPVVGVALLAGYTWWLVQSVPGGAVAGGAKVPDSVPDYVMDQATIERFDASGHTMSVLQGQNISHYVYNDRVVVKNLHLSAVDAKGQHLQATASEGHYMGQNSVVDLAGHAQVTVTPGPKDEARGPVVFDGDALSVNIQTRQLRSDKPARLTSRQGVINGSSLMHDAQTGISQVGGRVTGRLQAQVVAQP